MEVKMLKIKDVIQKVSQNQFIVNDLFENNRPFAITESTPEEYNFKVICIDFGNGIHRCVCLDNLILVLKEMYGVEYLEKALQEIKPYEEIKNIKVSDKSFEELLSRQNGKGVW